MFRFLIQLLLGWCFIGGVVSRGAWRSDDHLEWTADNKKTKTHVFRDSIRHLSSRKDLVKGKRMPDNSFHQVIFVIRQRNMDKLTSVLHDISDPMSADYGKHWTREQVVKFTVNPTARDAVVSYLKKKGAIIMSETLGGEYITANATIAVWEVMFNTTFYKFKQTHSNSPVTQMVRAEKYYIPKELDSFIESVFRTVEAPVLLFKAPLLLFNTSSLIPGYNNSGITPYATIIPGVMTPAKIRAVYNMSSSVQGSTSSTQAAFGAAQQYFSPADLLYFQQQYSQTIQPISASVGNQVNDTICKSSPYSCIEANLDIQYLISTSPVSPTTYWYTNLFFADWLVSVARTFNPPLVLSISYGFNEQYTSSSELNAFNTQAIKLGTMGVTIVVATGDDGANSINTCGYSVSYPATSPYVTAVGATSVRNTSA